MIRIGQAGIPLSCKGRTNKDGLVYTHNNLDFNAMEIQFVRGLYIMPDEEAEFIHDYAMENDIQLHVHAPYYINLAGDEEEVEMSMVKIMRSVEMASKTGAKNVVIHPGFYGENNSDSTMEIIVKNTKGLLSEMKKNRYDTNLAFETMGKQKVFGSLDEIIALCAKLKNTVPAIDIGHIHARTDGGLKTYDDFKDMFDRLEPLNLKEYLIHVTGVLYEDGNEQYHLPIKKGDMPLMPLIDVILDNRYDVTLISESPLLEHDAAYIRLQVERAIMKRTGKDEADYRNLSEIYI